MRLISLHIENFGGLSDIDMDFSNGINVIRRENGWGKSTLAEFIRVMFYGLEGGRKKEYSENDRIRFQPWNGQFFGGEITFEAGGKTYKIERNLAGKDKDMTYKLLDAETLLESDDLGENPGETLFGVDSESFRRTCFVGENGAFYRGINSAIGAKVSSLGQSGDLENYDEADKKMTNYLNAYSPTKKTGELYKLKTSINELTQNLRNIPAVTKRIEELKQSRDVIKKEISKLRSQQEHFVKMQKQAVNEEKIKVRRQTLTHLEEEVRQRKLTLDKRLESLPEEIPSAQEIEKAEAYLDEYSELVRRKSSSTDSWAIDRKKSLEALFAGNVPELSEMDCIIEKCNTVQSLIKKNEMLETLIETASEDGSTFILIMWISFFISAVLICGAIFTGRRMLIILGAVAGIVGICSLAANIRGADRKRGQNSETAGYAQIERYKQNIRANNSSIKETEADVKAFMLRLGVTYSRLDAESMLYDIRSKVKELQDIDRNEAAKEEELSRLDTRLSEVLVKLKDLLERLEIVTESDTLPMNEVRRKLSDLSRKIDAYETEVTEVQNAENRLKKYLKENPELKNVNISFVKENTSIPENYSEKISEQQELLSRYNRELEVAYEELDELSEEKEKLDKLSDEYEEMLARYNIVKQTQELLKEAKEQFIAKYMRPIKDSFDRYYSILCGDEDEFRIDANVNLYRKEEGAFHDIIAQSEGYGNAIGICMRLALLDTMYEKEKPFVILDDPFSGMDEAHLEGARKLINQISSKYQIIYMTCHESRDI